MAVAAARQAPPPADRAGARDRAGRRRAGRRSTRTRCASACARCATAGVEAVAVCLLHSYLNPAHERRIKEIVLEEFPEAYLSVSHEVLPLYREFERFSTVCLNAYVGPEGLALRRRASTRRCATIGFDARGAADAVLRRHGDGRGGARSGRSTCSCPGPVAGLIGGIWAGRMAGHENVVTLDMGGTSADIGVAAGGAAAHAPPARHEGRRLPGDGADGRHRHDRRRRRLDRLRRRGRRLPRRPAVGGRRSRPGLLRPRRRPSRPRPTRSSCSGGCARTAGCSAATCSSTSSSRRAAMQRGRRPARRVRSRRRRSARSRSRSSAMAQAIELNSVRRGYDPREFTLVAAGGAGPLFACDIALELEIPRVLVPPHPGITSATGLLATDLQHEFVATERHSLKTLDRDAARRTRFDELDGAGGRAARARRRAGGPAPRAPPRRLPLRRPGLRGALRRPGRRRSTTAGPRSSQDAFHARARARVRAPLRRRDRDRQRPRARHRAASPELQWAELEAGDGDPARREDGRARGRLRRRAARPERRATPFYDRERLRAGDRIEGPAIIEQYDSTTVDPARASSPRSTAPATSSSTAPRRAARGAGGAAGDADPDARDRRRLLGDRQGDGRRALPDELLVDHPRVGGPRRRASSTPRATSWPSRTRRRCSWARCRRSSRA